MLMELPSNRKYSQLEKASSKIIRFHMTRKNDVGLNIGIFPSLPFISNVITILHIIKFFMVEIVLGYKVLQN
jgi:hypothetical protein